MCATPLQLAQCWGELNIRTEDSPTAALLKQRQERPSPDASQEELKANLREIALVSERREEREEDSRQVERAEVG